MFAACHSTPTRGMCRAPCARTTEGAEKVETTPAISARREIISVSRERRTLVFRAYRGAASCSHRSAGLGLLAAGAANVAVSRGVRATRALGRLQRKVRRPSAPASSLDSIQPPLTRHTLQLCDPALAEYQSPPRDP